MRRLLLSAAAVLVLAGQARADLPVIDPAALIQMAQQLRQMEQDYEVYKGIFGSLLRAVDPNSMATGIIGSQPLPGASQIGQMLTGGGNGGQLSGLAGQFLGANTVYTPQSTGPNDFNASYLQRNGNTLSGVQAMAQQSISSIQSHIAGLVGIQSQLSTVQTSADVAAIQGRLQAEQANIAAQGVQAQAVQTMMMAQQQQYELQERQRDRQSADALLASVSGGGGGAGSISAASPQTAALNVPTFSATGP